MLKYSLFLNLLSFLCSSSLFAVELKPYTVYLKEGTVLVKLKDKSEVKIEKGFYAKVLELNPQRRNRFYVYDQQGVPLYETTAEGIVEIADDIRLLPNVDAEQVYSPKSVFKTTDKVARFDSQLSLHFDDLQLTPFNDIYNDQTSSVLAARYEVRTLYLSDIPFKFGFGLNYQSAYWKNDSEEVKLSILSVGPHFKYNFYKMGRFNAHAILGAELALIYQGVTDNFKDKYSAQLYDLGVESEWLSPLGLVTFGTHYRHHQVALSESNRTNLELPPKEFAVKSLGIMLGYKIEWEL